MPQTGMDGWVIAGVIITALALWLTWRQFRKSKTTDKNTNVEVTRSERVEIDATDKTKASLGVNRSKDVSINIGGSSDKSD
jgi:ABC-type nickel/cobalt efflux system permease component RcnA